MPIGNSQRAAWGGQTQPGPGPQGQLNVTECPCDLHITCVYLTSELPGTCLEGWGIVPPGPSSPWGVLLHQPHTYGRALAPQGLGAPNAKV